MDSSVKMMEVEESPISKEPTQAMRANGEVNGSCDDGSMDTCSSPTSSQQPPDSANSNDSSRFTEIQQQKVPASEVPAEEPMDEEEDGVEEADGEEEVEEADGESESEQNNRLSGVDDEHSGDTERSEKEINRTANATSGAESERELANGTEEDEEEEEEAEDAEDAISVDSGSTDPPIESVNIGDSENSEDENSEDEHSDTIELHSDGPNRHSDAESSTTGGDRSMSNVSRTNIEDKDREQKVKSTDSGDITIVENDSEHNKSNGEVCSSPEVQEICDLSKDKDSSSEIVNLDATSSPKKKKKQPQPVAETIAPRRSSRNLNKQKSYVEPKEDDVLDDVVHNDHDDDDEIEEITPEDPLGCVDPVHPMPPIMRERPRPTSMSGGTIVVKDTKRLVEIANTSKPSQPSPVTGKKEPTLVIIDTNSILSGRGPVPVTHKPSMPTTSYSVLPMALPAQGLYPANMRATITPIPIQKQAQQMMQHHSMTSQPQHHHHQQQQHHQVHSAPIQQQQQQQPNILPSLTDDMYVVEAPSFIVPYVYEKPPIKPLKEFVTQYGKEVEKCEKEQAEKEKLEKEKEKEKDKEKNKEGTEDDEDSDQDSKKENGTSEDSNSETAATDKEKLDLSKGADYEALLDAKPITPETKKAEQTNTNTAKSNGYFDNPLGKFFFNIGFNLVQEFVQTDLLKQQKRKRDREGGAAANIAIASLIKNLEFSKENNEPYHMEMKKCDYCSFRTESALALAHHLETPHMRNYVYRCNFCPLEVRSPHDILFHMEAEHNTRGRLERAPAFHQCPNCPFEDNQKGKLSRHLIACAKKFKPEKNLEPPVDWEPPAKIPRLSRGKQVALVPGATPYPTFTQQNKIPILPQQPRLTTPQQQAALLRQRGRPNIIGKMPLRTGMLYRPSTPGQVLVPTSYQYSGNQIYTVVSGSAEMATTGISSIRPLNRSQGGNFTIQSSPSASITPAPVNRSPSIPSKLVHQPSISITPLPRQSSTNSQSNSPAASSAALSSLPSMPMPSVKPGDPAAGKATFVICEICDGYIKDLEQLRNHMQWIHKVKIHPKMIYNRPPLNCQKCQFRFFTDQGLERHLLGSHGLVTSSMQEAANKGKDAGRCPVCGRVYQWKLLNHVARDHKITLKPAHLSYKCTVCTATFGMYKQFENHVYSAHSVVAKRVIEKKNNITTSSSSSSSVSRNSSESLLKPLKINDEITIIPQPAKPKPGTSNRGSDKGN